jgi:outer membrane lipoprotein carrier protein
VNALLLGALLALQGAGGPAPPSPQAATDSAALALLERTAVAYRSARTVRAQFAQVLTSPRTGAVYRSRGEFFQQGAERFAFRFSEPAEDRIVADGATLWLYLPSTAKGQALKVPRAAGGGMDLAASVLNEPARRYTVTAAPDTIIEGSRVRVVRIEPRSAQSPFTRGALWIDPATALVRRAEFVEASGLVRLLEFGRIRTGGALADSFFTFVPPPGVRVIDQAALLGGSVPPAR